MANAAITPRLSETAFKPAILPGVKAILPGVNLFGMYLSQVGDSRHPRSARDLTRRRRRSRKAQKAQSSNLIQSSPMQRVARTISDWLWRCQSMTTDNQ